MQIPLYPPANPAQAANAPLPTESVIEAADLLDELTKPTNEPYVIATPGVRIRGALNLRHQIIQRPLELKGCTFEGPVDLRYAEFRQVVSFEGSTFLEQLNSGDVTESCTIFHKDLNCSRVRFAQQLSFNGASVGGSAYFSQTHFCTDLHHSTAYDVDFTNFSCKADLECNEATFKGSVSFNCLRCGDALLRSVQFLDPDHAVDFRNATFEGNLEIWQMTEDASTKPVFHGGANFQGIKCGRKAIFTGCTFLSAHEVTFRFASFGRLLDCQHAEFNGPVSFVGAHVHDLMSFFDTDFLYRRAENGTSTGGAREPDDVDLRFVQCGGNLDLRETQVRGRINLGQATIGGKLRFEGAQMDSDVKLYDANIKILELRSMGPHKDGLDTRKRLSPAELESIFPFKKPNSLNLTSCSFERFHGGRAAVEHQLALALVNAQTPAKFSRDPYLQLERYYKGNGQEQAARTIHFLGHRAIRANARRREDEGKCVIWSRGQRWKDWWHWQLTGWGLQPIRIVIYAVLIVLLGATVYFPIDSLWPTPAYVRQLRAAGVQLPLGQVTPSDIIDSSTLSGYAEHFFERLIYSADLFLPAVDLGYTAKWEPPLGSVYTIYGSLHFTLGWILVPLLLASLAGIIKSD